MHFAIVSYTFPPSREIGGRRWEKFSKYLSHLGHAVTVVCADNSGTPEWYEKEYPGIGIMVLPKRYPGWLSGHTVTILEKLYYLITIRLVSPLTKQNLFDRGFLWKKVLLRALERLNSRKNIDVLVVTGAPFSLLYYGARFKTRHKNVFYIADLRDPWCWGSYYGIPTLKGRKRAYQEHSEHITMKLSDMLCYPTKNMGDVLIEKYPEFSSKLYLLPHAYEPDKFANITAKETKTGFIYGGSLYPGIEEYLMRLAQVLKSHPDSNFKWDIYTGSHYPLLDSIFEKERVKKHALIPEEKLFQCIADSAAYLAFFPPSDKDLISTKFFEIINAGTPILYIGEEGEVGRFIRENRIGVHILPERMMVDLPQFLNGNIPFKPGAYDITQYSFSNVTRAFVDEVKDRKSSINS